MSQLYLKFIYSLIFLFWGEDKLLLEKILRSGYKYVVLYGANPITNRLICLLSNCGVEVLSIVDRRAKLESIVIQGVAASASIPTTDKVFAVVICALSAESDIRQGLGNHYPLISVGE